jgi:hypothetical protein
MTNAADDAVVSNATLKAPKKSARQRRKASCSVKAGLRRNPGPHG